jgi:UDP-N-acetylmuramoyl-tripeptide--D-alanyl-D-alanine ligase
MIRLSAQEIANIVAGELVGNGSQVVSAGVETDSRLVGADFLFVAKPGEETDGHLFVESALERGATVALVERVVESSITQIVVKDVVTALGLLATAVLAKLRLSGHLTVIGVTGSNGKTSTKNMLGAVLSEFGETIAPRESFNNEVGAPISMLRATTETRFLVVELGAGGVGSIDYLAKMCKPDIGVELKVGLAHVGEFGGIETTAKIKQELVPHIQPGGVLLYNGDDEYCTQMAAGRDGLNVSFGTNAADYRLSDACLSLAGTSANVHFPDGDERELSLKILGEHQLMNALATIAVSDILGLDRSKVLASLASLPMAERWRMQLVERDGIAFINDAYNASPDSTKAALQTLAVLGRQTGRRTIAVIGEMAELGKFSAHEHDTIGRLAVRLNIDQVVAVGAGAKLVYMGASQEGSWDGESKFFERIDEALEALRGMLTSGDIVLIKSSKSANLRHLGDELMGVEQ